MSSDTMRYRQRERGGDGEAKLRRPIVRDNCRRLLQAIGNQLGHLPSPLPKLLRKRTQKGRNQLWYLRAWVKRLRLINTTFVAVTGSCGKTTTVALADAILSSAAKCVSGAGRSWTLPADSVMRADASTQFCIVETHAPYPGVIGRSLRLLRPQIGVVTTIGGDHYTRYRGLEATAREKGLVVESVPENGVAILNIDNPLIADMAKRTRARVLTFGRSPGADLRVMAVSSVWPLSLKIAYRDETILVETKLVGEHWLTSVLAAIGIGVACGVDLKTCAEMVKRVDSVFGRYTVHLRSDGASYVLDCHKAPYWTIAHGLAFVKGVQAPRKTIVFGTISDYPGAASPRYRRVARDALEVADRVIFVGPHSGHIDKLRQGAAKERLFGLQTTYQACALIDSDKTAGELIYVKASLTEHLERIMLSQLDTVVCWRERCGHWRGECMDCPKYRKTAWPFGQEFEPTLVQP